ncbi:hypothetical protein TWF751_006603 [Orbilia oligospora]|nr:hypothetical protein TWF751_006603 [Orbilia oligospora]
MKKSSRLSTSIAFVGTSSQVAPLRGCQPGTSAVLAHIKDSRATHDPGRIQNTAYTTDAPVFHPDAGDLIAGLVLEIVAKDKMSRIASSWRVYHDIVGMQPDLAKTLVEDWVLDMYLLQKRASENTHLM